MNLSPHNEDARFLELLQKWQSGDFTRANEQEMNALAAADAFRQEALEGFLEHPEFDHGTTLQSLRKRIEGKKARRVAIPQILALAAAFTLIISAIWFFNIRPVPTNTGDMAQHLPESGGKMDQPGPVVDSDTEQPTIVAPGRSSSTKAPATSPALDKTMAEAEMRPETAVLEQQDNEGAFNGLAEADDQTKDAVQQPGITVEQSTNRARPQELAKESAARADKKIESAKPAAPANSESKAAKKKTEKSVPASSQPAGGWEKFRLYLNTNAYLTTEAKANNVSGNVRLLFQVSNSGQPVNFSILKSLGYGCDEEAIRLVKSVPWLHGDNQSVTVDVPFVR